MRTGACPTGFSAVFRDGEGQVHHERCGVPLAFCGVRGRQEADFYCLTCMASVTVPLVVLEGLAAAGLPRAGLILVSSQTLPGRRRPGRKSGARQAA